MLVSVLELTDYLSSLDLNVPQHHAAELVLRGVQGEIETFLNRPLEPRTVVESLYPDAGGLLFPSVTPIISVASSTQAGYPVTLVVEGPVLYTLGGAYYSIPGYSAPIVVSYVGGIAADHPCLPHVRLEILRIAAREMTDRHDDTLGVQQLATDSPPQATAIGLTKEDEKRLDRWRRRVVV